CLFYSNPMPVKSSTELLNLKATLLSMPNIRKRVGLPGPISLPFTQTEDPCQLHNTKCETIPQGLTKRWPNKINFNGLAWFSSVFT
ncbi:hypothetical protein DFH28DRAFT_919728, partial [Melampsora americana]